MVEKRKLAVDYSANEIEDAYKVMSTAIDSLSISNSIDIIFELAWNDYLLNKFRFDLSLVISKRTNSLEWISFIRKWLNAKGFVGYRVDDLCISLMLSSRCTKIRLIEFIIRTFVSSLFTILKYRFTRKLKKLKDDETLDILITNFKNIITNV